VHARVHGIELAGIVEPDAQYTLGGMIELQRFEGCIRVGHERSPDPVNLAAKLIPRRKN
jgi:hypothetical protein